MAPRQPRLLPERMSPKRLPRQCRSGQRDRTQSACGSCCILSLDTKNVIHINIGTFGLIQTFDLLTLLGSSVLAAMISTFIVSDALYAEIATLSALHPIHTHKQRSEEHLVGRDKSSRQIRNLRPARSWDVRSDRTRQVSQDCRASKCSMFTVTEGRRR